MLLEAGIKWVKCIEFPLCFPFLDFYEKAITFFIIYRHFTYYRHITYRFIRQFLFTKITKILPIYIFCRKEPTITQQSTLDPVYSWSSLLLIQLTLDLTYSWSSSLLIQLKLDPGYFWTMLLLILFTIDKFAPDPVQ